MPGPVKVAVVGFGSLLAAVGPVSYIFGLILKFAGWVATVIGALGPVFQTVALKAMYVVEAIQTIGFSGLVAAAAPVVAVLAGVALAVVAIGIPMHMIFGNNPGSLIEGFRKGASKARSSLTC